MARYRAGKICSNPTAGTSTIIKPSGQAFGAFEPLLGATAVRQRCHRIGKLAAAGDSRWFAIDDAGFAGCVDLVATVCLDNYPDLQIPLHSRWRHFVIDGVDLWRHYSADFAGDPLELARSAIDLAFVSVLVDAGGGPDWCYREPIGGRELSRSEGLAAASIALFFDHLARFDPQQGWRVGARELERLDRKTLARAFQHTDDNPLLGLDGRLQLLKGLGLALRDSPDDGIRYTRPGQLVDECLELAVAGDRQPRIDITRVLSLILNRFGAIWPSGYRRDGLNLGDCGEHSLIETDDVTSGIVPFHKLSQWLTYSLIEPLQWAGFKVDNINGLTGLPEYRNGGLFLDTGALRALRGELLQETLSLDSEAVVEWRALTVYLLDRLAQSLRDRFGLDENQLPLGAVLQGGSWAAGRRIAAERRPGGPPPLKLAIDGTIF